MQYSVKICYFWLLQHNNFTLGVLALLTLIPTTICIQTSFISWDSIFLCMLHILWYVFPPLLWSAKLPWHLWLEEKQKISGLLAPTLGASASLRSTCKFMVITNKRKTSEPHTFARPWFTSQKRTKGLRSRQKTLKADGLIIKPWFTFKSGSQKQTWNLFSHYKKRSQNRTKNA